MATFKRRLVVFCKSAYARSRPSSSSSFSSSSSLQVSLRPEPCFFSSVSPQPVPPLAQTLQGYLKALEPLLPREELNHTRRMVQEFGRPGGLGAQLQEGLERRARQTKNWVRVRTCVRACVFLLYH